MAGATALTPSSGKAPPRAREQLPCCLQVLPSTAASPPRGRPLSRRFTASYSKVSPNSPLCYLAGCADLCAPLLLCCSGYSISPRAHHCVCPASSRDKVTVANSCAGDYTSHHYHHHHVPALLPPKVATARLRFCTVASAPTKNGSHAPLQAAALATSYAII